MFILRSTASTTTGPSFVDPGMCVLHYSPMEKVLRGLRPPSLMSTGQQAHQTYLDLYTAHASLPFCREGTQMLAQQVYLTVWLLLLLFTVTPAVLHAVD